MINIQELRVGNIIRYSTGGFITVKPGHFTKSMDFNLSEDCFPVELTEEILLKCGFVRSDVSGGNGFDNYKAFCIDSFIICIVDDIFKLWNDCDDSFYSYAYLNINSVHQLQNIYFALTNKELEIAL